ncbi:MAG TPA: trigger factor [Bacteroidales bacterium]|nr:trigger factor [Bacteroidales bacterium]
MQVQIEQNGALEATIEVRLSKSEVDTEVNKAIKDYQRKAAMPGFRAGKVPLGLVKKMYGSAISAEQINKKVSDGLNNYLEENKIQFLGYPIADYDRTGRIDFDTASEFNFYFLLGLKPVLNIDLSSLSMEYPKVNVDDAEVTRTIDKMLVDYPMTIHPEHVGTSDKVVLKATQADDNGREVENGHAAQFTLDLASEAYAVMGKVFDGRPEGDEFLLNLSEYLTQDQAVQLLKLGEDNAHLATQPFNVVIDEIVRTVPSELNEEFFGRMFPGQEINTEEAFRAKVAEEIQKHFDSQSDYLVYVQLLKQLLTEEQIPLPDNFLKRWLLENADNENKVSDIEKNFEMYKRTFRFQVFTDYLQREFPELIVTRDEVRAYAFNHYYGPYMSALGNDEAFVKKLMDGMDDMLNKHGEGDRIHNQLEEQKMIKLFKEKVSLVNKPMTLDEFNQFAKTFDDNSNELTDEQ